MNSLNLKYLVDIIMLILFVITAITSVIIFYFKEIINVHGIGRTLLGTVHNYAGILFVIIMSLHVVLHYKWIINTSKNILKRN